MKKLIKIKGCTLKPITKRGIKRCKKYANCKYYKQCLDIASENEWDGFSADCKGYKKKTEKELSEEFDNSTYYSETFYTSTLI
jgi:hypothetical protein